MNNNKSNELFEMHSDLPLAGKNKTYSRKEWKKIYGYEVGLVGGAKWLKKDNNNSNIVDKRTKGLFEAFEYESANKIQIEADGKIICDVETYYRDKEESKANAAFICKAVNNYDSLLEALKRLVSYHNIKEMDAVKDYSQITSILTAKEIIKNCEK